MTTESQNIPDKICPYIEQCDLVTKNMSRMPKLIKRIQSYYCNKLTSQCARRWIFDTLGKRYLPPLLLPNQWEWAREIICEHDENEKTKSPKQPADST